MDFVDIFVEFIFSVVCLLATIQCFMYFFLSHFLCSKVFQQTEKTHAYQNAQNMLKNSPEIKIRWKCVSRIDKNKDSSEMSVWTL